MPPTMIATRLGLTLAALALLALAGCRGCGTKQAPLPPPPVSAVEAELATLDLPELEAALREAPEPPEIEAFVSEWGTGGAFVLRTAGGARLVHGPAVSPVYPGIARLTLSPDGRRMAFAVAEPGGKSHVVLDGEAGPSFDSVERLAFTRGGRLAYRAAAGDRWHVVLDRWVGEPRAAVGEPRGGRDGMTVLVAEQAAAGGPFVVAAYDGQLQRTVLGELAGAEEVVLNADGTRAAAIVAAGGKKRVVLLELGRSTTPREGAPYDDVVGLDFDPSGEHVLYAATLGDRLHFVLDDKAEPVPAPGLYEVPVLNQARRTVGVVLANERPSFHVVFDPRAPGAGKAYDSVTDPTVSPDGSRYAYVAGVQGRSVVVVNGTEGPVFDRVVTPRFSPDGAFLVYRARDDGKRFVVVADAEGKVLRRHPDHEQVFPLAFTPDGGSVAYAVKEGPRLLWKVEKLR